MERALGAPIDRSGTLSGGCIADVRWVASADGHRAVVKAGGADDRLDIEGRSLAALKDRGGLPVPDVYLADRDLLVMQSLRSGGGLTASVQADAAGHIARLHACAGRAYGFDEDTRIGPLHQPNPWTERWSDFFRDQRLLPMARLARERQRLTAQEAAAIDRLAGKLGGLLDPPRHPSLLHGDLWSGNILAAEGRIEGFIDPAVYYGDPEMDLAFSTLFGTFGEAFFECYADLRAHDLTGFHAARRDLYNLYPLLVHTVLFGGGYGRSVMAVVHRFAG